MIPTIAILAPGAMGSAVAGRLREHGVKVLTSLDGRSEATKTRAAAAGMIAADDATIANADIILSIVPPGEALALAEHLATLITKNAKKPVIVDCNAVNVDTIRKIEDIVLSSGAHFVDAAIIGFPPKPGTKSPAFYLSGDDAKDVAVLGDLGLDIRIIDGPVGAASALKMAYAGINKGITGARGCDGAGRDPRRRGRCVARRIGAEPARGAGAVRRLAAGHDPEILSLGRRDARDRGIPGRGPSGGPDL